MSIGRRQKKGRLTTRKDIVKEFKIKRDYTYKLLEVLESEKSVIKGTKIVKDGTYHHTYILIYVSSLVILLTISKLKRKLK